ncbi:hypothetical protein [Flavobacterium sp.]|uniref:hypothetical protein n=1 Tax=Flavobacterium sp. TaxID=239 RepID=UPI0026267156|nr:hypothetical protein [Flavobacterium sp.]
MKFKSDFIALLNYKKSEDGGRQNFALSGYRPAIKFPFSEMQTSGIQTFIDKEKVFPGETVKAEIKILSDEYFKHQLCENLEFDFREGPNIIGTGKIISILNPKLKSEKHTIMDSRIIYEANKTYHNNIEWLMPSTKSESEWLYLKFEETNSKKIIQEIIDSFFESEILFVSITRNESFQTEKININAKIEEYLKNQNFSIWNQEFNKVIEFNKIGIYRKGIKASH